MASVNLEARGFKAIRGVGFWSNLLTGRLEARNTTDAKTKVINIAASENGGLENQEVRPSQICLEPFLQSQGNALLPQIQGFTALQGYQLSPRKKMCAETQEWLYFGVSLPSPSTNLLHPLLQQQTLGMAWTLRLRRGHCEDLPRQTRSLHSLQKGWYQEYAGAIHLMQLHRAGPSLMLRSSYHSGLVSMGLPTKVPHCS